MRCEAARTPRGSSSGAASPRCAGSTPICPRSTLYRLAQAVTTFKVSQVTTCAIIGTDRVEGGAQVLDVDPELARRVGKDVRDDARIDHGCG